MIDNNWQECAFSREIAVLLEIGTFDSLPRIVFGRSVLPRSSTVKVRGSKLFERRMLEPISVEETGKTEN